MKKIVLTCLFFIIFIFTLSINVNAEVSWTTTNLTTTDLGYGITLDKYEGTSKSDFNSTTQKDGRTQEIYTANISKNSPARVVQWSINYGVSNAWKNYKLEDIALDYESNNPGSKVIVATNNWLSAPKDGNKAELDSVQIYDGLNYRLSDKQGTGDNVIFRHDYIPRPNFLGFDDTGKKAYYTNDFNNGENYTNNMWLSFYNGVRTERTKLNLEVTKINEEPSDGEIAIYFPNYDGGTTTIENATIYKMDGITLRYDDIPGTEFTQRDAFAMGYFSKKVNAINSEDDVFYVVSKNEIFNSLDIEPEILVAQYELQGEFENVTSGTTYYFHIVRDGECYPGTFGHWNEINCEVHPRTAFIIKEDGTFALSVIDGRSTERTGMDYQDMANFYKTNYNAYNVFNYDGGGSSSMIVANQEGTFDIVNTPSDGNQRYVSNATLIVVDKEPYDIKQTELFQDKIELEINNVDPKITKIEATLNGVTEEMKDGKITFNNLTSNNTYDISFNYYYDDNYYIGSHYACNTAPIYSYMDSYKVTHLDNNQIKITFDIKDPDLKFFQGSIQINDDIKFFTLEDAEVIFENINPYNEYNAQIIIKSKTGLGKKHIEEYNEKLYFEISNIEITGYKEEMNINETSKLEVMFTPSGLINNYSFISSDETILSVDNLGNIKALKEGVASITIKTEYNVSKTITIKVIDPTPDVEDPDNENPDVEKPEDNSQNKPVVDEPVKGCNCGCNKTIEILNMFSLVIVIIYIMRKKK